ncbi:MAG: LysE family translocator, partial [Verrucomicrobiales bacterium]
WLLGGVGLKRILTSPKQVRVFNVTMALLLVASMVPVVHQLLFL